MIRSVQAVLAVAAALATATGPGVAGAQQTSREAIHQLLLLDVTMEEGMDPGAPPSMSAEPPPDHEGRDCAIDIIPDPLVLVSIDSIGLLGAGIQAAIARDVGADDCVVRVSAARAVRPLVIAGVSSLGTARVVEVLFRDNFTVGACSFFPCAVTGLVTYESSVFLDPTSEVARRTGETLLVIF